jgi:hypothetical protein
MFDDPHVQAELNYLLSNVFNYVPSGVRTTGDFAGEPYDEFWWRECTGEQNGYVMVWYRDNQFNTHHTYHRPDEIYT